MLHILKSHLQWPFQSYGLLYDLESQRIVSKINKLQWWRDVWSPRHCEWISGVDLSSAWPLHKWCFNVSPVYCQNVLLKTQKQRVYTLVIISSIVIGGVTGFSQTRLRKILAYSSINHIGWILVSLSFGIAFWAMYFVVYSVIRTVLILAFKFLGIFHFNKIQSSPNTLL